ncbi:two-component system sensor histidine kinase NtrB [Parasphingorhabdus halotolerans]|uniref:histidine kinase n=1 Tax=Parasphingorhabdus halotolerans TaxID=2725558 RepID=A0A6H2DKE7_9SPHN|nr:ATP-binding protein [Parasphingorhabdus halotolerans]QJB68221.1 PAS domain-containing protein [Parasphingorhabdus halotolerans]
MSELPSAEQIFASLPDALLLIDEDHHIGQVNPVAENFLQTSSKRLVGRKIGDFISFVDERLTNALEDCDANLAARNVPITIRDTHSAMVNFEIHAITSNEDWRLVSIAPLPVDGAAIGEREDQPHQFSIRAPDILGHEIKNPLAAIKGAAQLLNRGLSEDQKPLADMIQAEVKRITTLLDRMQSLSTNQPAQIEPVNIHSLVDEARKSIETAQNGAIKIREWFDPSLPDVLIDRDAMMQILINLLSNAVEATRGMDDPHIEVMTRYSFGAALQTKGSDQAIKLPVELIVKDNGPGVDPEIESEIFSPFVTTKNEGQGLGLALVRKLIGDMNGRIRHERDALTGHTQFMLFLPVAEKGQ